MEDILRRHLPNLQIASLRLCAALQNTSCSFGVSEVTELQKQEYKYVLHQMTNKDPLKCTVSGSRWFLRVLKEN